MSLGKSGPSSSVATMRRSRCSTVAGPPVASAAYQARTENDARPLKRSLYTSQSSPSRSFTNAIARSTPAPDAPLVAASDSVRVRATGRLPSESVSLSVCARLFAAICVSAVGCDVSRTWARGGLEGFGQGR